MTKTEFIKEVAAKTGFTQKDTKEVLDTMQTILFTRLKETDDKIAVFDGVTFMKEHKPAREGRNPRTGEKIMIEAKDTPKVKLGKLIKEAVK